MGGIPGRGRGKAVMNVLKAVAGIEVSTECVVLILDTRWTKGARISGGSLSTRALTLCDVSPYTVHVYRRLVLPLNCLVLDLSILVIQGL